MSDNQAVSDISDISDIAARWDGVKAGYKKLTFEQAKADMDALLAIARQNAELKRQIAALEARVAKRNNDMRAFAAEVSRLANQKYSDYLSPKD